MGLGPYGPEANRFRKFRETDAPDIKEKLKPLSLRGVGPTGRNPEAFYSKIHS